MTKCVAAMIALSPIAGAVLAATPTTSSLRIHQRIDANWRFEQSTGLTASSPDGVAITQWKYLIDPQGQSDAATMAATDFDTTGWKDVAAGNDVFDQRPGFAWYRVTISKPQAAPLALHFKSVDDNGTVYLNGKLLGHHEGWNDPFDMNPSGAWNPAGPNVIAVLVQNTAGGGGIADNVVLATGENVAPPEASVGYDASSWQPVHLPHDFVVGGQFDRSASEGHGFLPSGAGWYRKTILLPESARGKEIALDFDGVYRDSTVWVNGHVVGQHPCGYTGFRCDITSVVNIGGNNEIAVFANARKPEGWWYEGGGIYRHVWLDITSPVSVAPDGAFVTSTITGLQAGEKPSAVLAIATTVANSSSVAATAMVTSTVVRPDGSTAGTVNEAVKVPADGSADAAAKLPDTAPQLWSLETPRLYRLHTVVSIGGKPVDTLDTPFGVRSIRFDADTGFYLNEKPVKIKGTCNHQDFAGIGVALPDGILAWRVKKLKEMGSNAYRTSHDEVASELLDACDNQGMLVMDETRHFGDGEDGKAGDDTPATDLSNLREQVMRDRNHPSVIMWSIGNEEYVQGSTGGLRIGTAMKAVCNELDPSRPVSEAINSRHGEGSSTILDLEGFNYYPSGYDQYHSSHPGHPLYGSETASALSTRGVYTTDPFPGAGVGQQGDKANGWVAAYDVNGPGWGQTAENAWKPIADRPYVAGGFVWTGFDYRGEPTPFSWPDVNSEFGIMDMCGFPKDSYYYYQSVWGDKPMVHILPHWNWAGKEGQPINLWAFSNADQVELFLNGTSLGAKAMPKNGHAEWQVPYSPGTLSATATTNGKLIATDTIATTGAPAAIKLVTDRPSLAADGEDESPVTVEIVDAEGRIVPTADSLVTFTTTGAGTIAGVGNGNPSSLEPDVATQRKAFNGLCMAVVRAGETLGLVTLTAKSEGINSATLTISVK